MNAEGPSRSLIRIAIAILAIALAVPVANAQRAMINTDFEDNDPRGPGAPSFQIFNDSAVPGWEDETGRIELWDSTFNGVTSFSGQVHAEMNANSPGTFYQEICMEAGESFTWTFAHAARSGGPGFNPQVAVFEIVDPATGTLIQSLATQDSFIGAGWSVNSGSAAYTGPAGVQRFQFRSTNAGSYGNFLDNIVVSLTAYVELAANSGQSEANSTGPGMIVSGTVDTATDVTFTVTGGSASLGLDYTIDDTAITVPPGVYPDTFFPLPITILNDTAFESNETIEIAIGTPSSSELTIASGQCGPAPTVNSVFTILDNDPNLAIEKSVETFDPSLTGADVFAIPGNDVIYTFEIENTGNGPIQADSLFLVDELPSEIVFLNADLDGPTGPELGAISFTQTGSGLTFDPVLHVGFSDSSSKPSEIADCNYNPGPGYDDDVTYLCVQPDGVLSAGEMATFRFRAQIK